VLASARLDVRLVADLSTRASLDDLGQLPLVHSAISTILPTYVTATRSSLNRAVIQHDLGHE
jgi:hypothetical protein